MLLILINNRNNNLTIQYTNSRGIRKIINCPGTKLLIFDNPVWSRSYRKQYLSKASVWLSFPELNLSDAYPIQAVESSFHFEQRLSVSPPCFFRGGRLAKAFRELGDKMYSRQAILATSTTRLDAAEAMVIPCGRIVGSSSISIRGKSAGRLRGLN